MLFRNKETGEYVVSFIGTAGTTDALVDASSGLLNYNQQLNSALNFVNSILSDPNLNVTKENLTLTGHSLGGMLTQLVGAKLEIPGYAYNPWGTSSLLKYPPIGVDYVIYRLLNAFGLYTVKAEEFAKNNILNISYQEGNILPIFYKNMLV